MNTRDSEQRSIRWGSNARTGRRVGDVVHEGGGALGRSQGCRCAGEVGGGLGGRGEQAALLVVAACEAENATHDGGGRVQQESPFEELGKEQHKPGTTAVAPNPVMDNTKNYPRF